MLDLNADAESRIKSLERSVRRLRWGLIAAFVVLPLWSEWRDIVSGCERSGRDQTRVWTKAVMLMDDTGDNSTELTLVKGEPRFVRLHERPNQ